MHSVFARLAWSGLAAFAALGCARAAASSAPDGESASDTSSGFAIVELFTSEGCSSCPPADDVLRDLVAEAARTGHRIYALAFHVGYWNSLGWADPYSSSMSTDRQHAYAHALGQQGVYTPEMIVNGNEAFVGSDSSRARKAVGAALRGPSGIVIDLRPTMADGQAVVDFNVRNAPRGEVLHLALIQLAAQTRILAGENAGRTLRHTNVVRGFQTVQLAAGASGRVSFPRLSDAVGRTGVIAYVQNPETMTVHGAMQASF
jgi:hypothetical protein